MAAVFTAMVVGVAFGGDVVFTGQFWKEDGFYGDGRVESAEHLKTPDKPPHGHELTYRMEIPETGWYAPFFKGAPGEQDFFVDGRLVAQQRDLGRAGADGFAQGPALYLEKGVRELRLERLGRRGFPMRMFECVEMRRLDPGPADWFFADKSGHDVVRLGECVNFAVTAGLPDRAVSYEFKAALQCGPEAKEWTTLATLEFPKTDAPVRKVAALKLPKEGMFFVKAFADGKELPANAFPRFEVVAIDVNEHGATSAKFDLENVVDIDCVAQAPDAEANGKSSVARRKKLAYRESHDCSKATNEPYDGNDPTHLSCFSYRVKVPAAQVPYLLEVDYPDDARRSVCIRHDWVKEGTKLYLKGNAGYQTKSYETGGFFPISGEMRRQGQIIWPLSTEGYVTVINQSAGTRAAAARIRISRFKDDLPPAQGASAKGGRTFAYWSEEGDSFGIMLGAGAGVNFAGGGRIPYLEAAKRWYQMIRFYGGNAMSGCGVAYQGAYWHSKALKGMGLRPFSALRMFALLGEKYRMSFIPEWFNNQGCADKVIYPRLAGGLENSQAKNASGSLAGGGVNALCPAVQDAIVEAMREIHDDIGDSPAFKGLTVRSDPWQFRGEFFFKSLNWGYNESVVRAFEKETGVKVPAGTATDHFHFLTSPGVRDRWIRWRCNRIGDYHRRILEALRGGTRKDLFFGMAGQFDQENLYAREETLVERALGCGVDAEKYRGSDGFSIIPISRYGSRTPSAGDRRIYDEFFRTDSTEGGMCTPRAFASYMTYMELGTGWPAAQLGFDLKEKGGKPPYHCSGVIAAGRAGLEKFAVVLAEQDTAYFREGGNSDCLGSPDVFGPWFAEFERIPAVKFDRVEGLNDPVAVWQRTVDGRLWYYAVNKESFASEATVRFSDGTSRSFVLEPWGLKAFDEEAGRTVASASSTYPEPERLKVRKLLAYAQSLQGKVRDLAYAGQLAKAWAAAEAGKWWRARVELNMAPMYRGYAEAGGLPGEVLRTPFPDKLDTQSPKNGHWNLCTPTKPVALIAFDGKTAKIVDSRQVNDQWRGEKAIWSEKGEITFTLDVPAEGRYNLVLGAVGEEKGVASVTVNGSLLGDVCRFAKAKEPMTASFRGIPLEAGKATVKVSAASGVGLYGVRFLPALKPIPGTDWAVAGPFKKFWGALGGRRKGVEGDLALKEGFDDLMKTDLSKVEWKMAAPGVRDALWDRGVQMPLRIASTGADRLIARTTIMSERERTATLVIAVDWWCRATLNGESVKTDVVGGGSEVNGCSFWGWYPMYTGIVRLKPGANDLVLYVNGGSLGSAITGWVTDDDDILTTANLPKPGLTIGNGRMSAEIDSSLGGRVISFGPAGGRNWFWRNEPVRNDPDPKVWKNVGGEKTWVGTIGDWTMQFGRKRGWPPPKWFDGSQFSVERAEKDRVEMRSRVSPGDVWTASLRRAAFFEGDSLVIRSTVETLAATEETPDRQWNWSVTQVPEAKLLAVHLTGRGRAEWGHTEGRAVKPVQRIGEWAFYDFAEFGVNGLMNFDADVIAAQYDDGWLVVRHRADPKAVEPFEKPRCAVFHSGFQPKSMGEDRSRMYIELEFLAYGPNTTMDVVESITGPMTPGELIESLEPESYRRMREDRVGMFIHWGIYSIPAKGEWLMFREKMPKAEYDRYADRFKPPADFSPREWAKLAKRMGARYAVLTTRHHDGFALWDTKTTDFNSVKTAAGRDFVREFVDGCRAEGIRVGLYYSIMNWQFEHSPNGVFDQEVWDAQVKCTHDALRELMTNYGRIDYLWYDGCSAPGSTDADTMQRMWKVRELDAMVRELQPGILINDRSARPEDYATPEQSLTPPVRGRLWESCITCNGMWGYKAADTNWKSSETLFRSVLHCARYGGNILINVGPRPDGSVPEACVKSLEGLGDRLAKCPEAIYGSTRDKWTEATHEAGVVTKANGSYWLWALNSDRLDGVERMEKVADGVYKVAFRADAEPCNWLGGRHDLELKAGDTPILGDDSGREAPPSGTVEPLDLAGDAACAFDLPSGGRWKLEVGYVNADGFKDTYVRSVEAEGAKTVEVKVPGAKRVYARRQTPVWKAVKPESWSVAGTFASRYYESRFDEAAVKEVYAKDLLAEAGSAAFVPVPPENDKADKSDVRVNHNYSDPKKGIGYAFARRNFPSESARTVFAALGVDWWGKVYVNGELALDTCSGWKPKPFPLKLKAGDNDVLVITHGGCRQHWFTFYSNH